MPRVNIWIREMDVKAWKGLENKSDWLHRMLNKDKKGAEPKIAPEQAAVKPEVIKTAQDAEKAVESAKVQRSEKVQGVCKNGHLLAPGSKKCSWKGCKYAK